jgi:hypothetical protein
VSTTDLPPRITTHYAVAVDEAARRARQPVESFIGRPVARGAAFALVVPVMYAVHASPPEAALHPSAHGVVGVGTEVVLVLIVFVLVAGRVVVRLVSHLAPARA